MTEHDHELDDELRRLFADDRLTLPVSVAVEHAVLAGARKRHRRRLSVAAAGGVLAVAAMVFLTATLTGLGRAPGSTATAAKPLLSQTLTTAPADPTPAPAVEVDELGPTGVDGLTLGMPMEQMLKSVARWPQAGADSRVGTCLSFSVLSPLTLAMYGASSAPSTPTLVDPTSIAKYPLGAKARILQVLVSPTFGVVQIGGALDLRTPEGIAVGTQLDRLYTMYPMATPTTGDATASGRPSARIVTVPVPNNGKSVYVFDVGPSGAVTSMWLRSAFTFNCDK